MKTFLKIILFAFLGIIVFTASFVLTIPANFISGEIKNWLEIYNGIVIKEEGIERTYPLGIEMRDAKIFYTNAEKHVFTLDTLNIQLSVPYLFTGRVKMVFDGGRKGGVIRGSILSGASDTTADFMFENIDAAISSTAEGNFTGRLRFGLYDGKCPEGDVDINGKDINVRWEWVSGIPFPLEKDMTGNMHARANDCKIALKVLHLKGSNLLLNAHGSISLAEPYLKSPMDIDVELMPSLESMGNDNYILSMLSRFMKPSNRYSMKLKGTIEKPYLSQ